MSTWHQNVKQWQDELAAAMLEDLREILKAEVDENLRDIQDLTPTPVYNEYPTVRVPYGTDVASIIAAVKTGQDKMLVSYYDPKPTWKEWFLDCLGL